MSSRCLKVREPTSSNCLEGTQACEGRAAARALSFYVKVCYLRTWECRFYQNYTMSSPSSSFHGGSRQGELPWLLRLYVAENSRASESARRHLKYIVDEHLPPNSRIEVIDLAQCPEIAEEDQILAIPTLVRKMPPPLRRIIGDLSNTARVLTSLGYRFELPVP
jgi:circadian clock protein KaiB